MSDGKCPECGGFRGLPRMLFNDQENPKECDNAFHATSEVLEVPSDIGPEPEAPTPAPAPAGIAGPVGSPVCPYCGADPCNLKGRQTTMGPALIIVIRCANEDCRKMLGIVPLGLAQPPVPVPVGPPQ